MLRLRTCRVMIRGLIGALAVGKAGSTATAQASPVTAFVHVNVIPMDSERVLRDQTVLVRGNRITAVGPVARVRVPAGARTIEGQGQFLMPGLADMHSHSDGESALMVYLANGVTTIRLMGAQSAGVRGDLMMVRKLQASGALVPPRVAGVAWLDDCKPDVSLTDCFTELKAAGYDLLKLRPLIAANPIHFDSILAAAQRARLPLGGHIFPGPGVERALEVSYRSIEHLFGYLDFLLGYRPAMVVNEELLRIDTIPREAASMAYWDKQLTAPAIGGIVPAFLVHGGTIPDTMAWLQPNYRLASEPLRALAEATRRAGTWNAPTLVVMEMMMTKAQKAQRQAKAWRRYFDLDLQIVKALHDAGAGLLLSVDMSGIAPGYGVHRELELLVQAGLTPYQALVTGTRNVAAYLGTQDSAGTIAVGKWADLILLDKNPLIDVRNTTAPVGVMADGQWLPRRELEARLDSLDAPNCGLGALRHAAAQHRGITMDDLLVAESHSC